MREFCMSGSARWAVRLSTLGRPYRNLLIETSRISVLLMAPSFPKRLSSRTGRRCLRRSIRAPGPGLPKHSRLR
jgi:hypothetical protein